MLNSLTPAAAQLIREWQQRKADADAAKMAIAAERVARDAVVAHIFKDDPVGTANFPLTDGWLLKYCRTLDYKFDTTPVDDADPTGTTKLDAALDAIEAASNEGKFLVERLVKWTPELRVSEYNKLPPYAKAIIDGVLTTKDKAPELSLVPPKAAK